MSTVDSNSGNFESYTEIDTPVSDIAHAVVSSSSIPLVFPPHKHFAGKVYIDGGSAYGVDIVSAVARCRELVDDDSKIILDVILCHDQGLSSVDDTGNAINNYMRYRQIQSDHKKLNNLVEFQLARPTVQFRHLIMPSGSVASGLKEIDFNQANIEPMFSLGITDG